MSTPIFAQTDSAFHNEAITKTALDYIEGWYAGDAARIEQLKEVTILDRYNNAAVVKIVASDWIDYLQVAKFNGDWKIINVLWELKPK